MARFAPALALAFALALAAGCFGGAGVPNEVRFQAFDGKVSPGWAYDGVDLTAGQASMDGRLDNAANTGLVNVTFTYHASPYVVTFDTFAQAADKPYQDGGIAMDLDEHGSTGIGDTLIPKFHAKAVAWGTAKIVRDGVPVATPWTAHLMLSEDTIRTPDGKISNAAGAPYDPAKPDDAKVIPGDPQALFFIRHPDGANATKPPATASDTLSCTAQCTVSTDVPVDPDAEVATLNITIDPVQGPLAAGQGEIHILDANGTDIIPATPFQVTPANAPLLTTIELGSDLLAGPITVQITGTGAFTARVDSIVTYDLHPFIVVTWDEIAYS